MSLLGLCRSGGEPGTRWLEWRGAHRQGRVSPEAKAVQAQAPGHGVSKAASSFEDMSTQAPGGRVPERPRDDQLKHYRPELLRGHSVAPLTPEAPQGGVDDEQQPAASLDTSPHLGRHFQGQSSIMMRRSSRKLSAEQSQSFTPSLHLRPSGGIEFPRLPSASPSDASSGPCRHAESGSLPGGRAASTERKEEGGQRGQGAEEGGKVGRASPDAEQGLTSTASPAPKAERGLVSAAAPAPQAERGLSSAATPAPEAVQGPASTATSAVAAGEGLGGPGAQAQGPPALRWWQAAWRRLGRRFAPRPRAAAGAAPRGGRRAERLRRATEEAAAEATGDLLGWLSEASVELPRGSAR